MLSMASALEKTKKNRCRVFVEVVTTSTTIIDTTSVFENPLFHDYMYPSKIHYFKQGKI